tara:strand:+ start:104 stop:412 length:309 start_codon:yes stop_codon:yes gene_type:complete
MQKVWFEKHQGLYSEEFDYFNFYGLYFDGILQAANFFKHIKGDPEIQYEGWMEKGIKCLKDVETGIIYSDDGIHFPDEDFLKAYIKQYGKNSRKVPKGSNIK